MLKLEKKSRRSGVTIALKEKGRFFTPLLLKAFAAAFFIHILGVSLFHISGFKLGYNKNTFGPVAVNIDMTGREENLTYAAIEKSPHLPLLDLPHHFFLSLETPRPLSFTSYSMADLPSHEKAFDALFCKLLGEDDDPKGAP